MKTKIILSAFCFILLSSLIINAQPRMDMTKRVNHLKERLNLNEEQTVKVKGILAETQKEIEKEREKNQGDRFAMMTKMREITEKSNKKIEELLNEKQKKEFAKLLEEQRKEREQWRKERGF